MKKSIHLTVRSGPAFGNEAVVRHVLPGGTEVFASKAATYAKSLKRAGKSISASKQERREPAE